MQEYTGFAQVYDLFMDNVPYDTWCEYLTDLLQEYGVTSGLVVDLCCGTGAMTRRLKACGYDMIGVDSSNEMLQQAIAKEREGILYLCQDMREFELYGTVRAIVCLCDSMNYMQNKADMRQVFQLVNNYLDPQGVFIFDLNTIYKYQNVLGDTVIGENRDEGSFIWENYYDAATQQNTSELTLFIPEGHGLYRKYEESHQQRGYPVETIKTWIEEAGLELLATYDAFTKNPFKHDSERVIFIAREKGK
jgi:SAM-dependent methyltransferase